MGATCDGGTDDHTSILGTAICPKSILSAVDPYYVECAVPGSGCKAVNCFTNY